MEGSKGGTGDMQAAKMIGFTLVETTVVLGILAILVALGIPGFGATLERQRTQGTLHLLSADFALARNAAVMRRKAVVVCPRSATGACDDGSDWSNGWLVFSDDDGNRQPDSLDDIVRSEDAPASRDLLQLHSTRPAIRYQPDGRSAHSNLTVYVCSARAIVGQVIVNNIGRVRTSRALAGLPCPA